MFFFGESMNLARIKFILLMILALCKVQTVSFYKLSTAYEGGSDALIINRTFRTWWAKNALSYKMKRFFVTFGAVKYATCLYLWPMPAYLRE